MAFVHSLFGIILLSLFMSDIPVKALLATLPIILFLLSLIYMDSYKLVGVPAVLGSILAGAAAAAVSFWINTWALSKPGVDPALYTRYGSPAVEELMKSLVLVYLIRSRKVGFLVDAAIYGFAIGAGFAMVENLYYLQAIPNAELSVWVIRGFGTATMHGCSTALFGIVSKLLVELVSAEQIRVFFPGLLGAIAAHSLHNHFVVPPLLSTAGIMLIFPGLVFLVFRKSEHSLQRWLGVGFDADVELLRLIHSGELSNSRIGRYLQSLRRRFRGEVVADMLCYLRIQVELAIRAKGAFLMLASGFRAGPDPAIQEKLEELEYLERAIGKTGKQAIAPFIHTKSHDLWQLRRLQTK